MLYRELKQALVIRFLMYFRAGLHHLLVYLKESCVGQAVARIGLLWERAAKVEVQPLHGVRTEQMIQVLRLPQAEPHVLDAALHQRFRTGYKHVRGLFHRDVIYIGISPRKFQNETPLSAADLKVQRVVVSEHLHAVEEQLVVKRVVGVLVLILHFEHYRRAGLKALLKVLLFSHSHM